MTTTKKVAKSAITIMIFLILSKLLGFFRDILIASKFGSGFETDAYIVASTTCTIIIGIIGGALSTTLIPIFSGIKEKKDIKGIMLINRDLGIINICGYKNRVLSILGENLVDWYKGNKYKIRYMNNILNTTLVITAILAFLSYFFSPTLIRIFAKGFTGKQFELAVQLNRIGVPMTLFMVSSSVFSSYLHSKERFSISAATGLPYNMVFIIFLMFFTKYFGITGLMVASVMATFTRVLIQIPAIYKLNYSYKFEIDLKDKNLRKAFWLTTPVVLGSMVEKINIVIDRTLASDLVEGSISALNYASRFNNLILNIFVLAITTVIFPMLTKESSKKNKDSIKKIMSHSINVIMIITIPATIGIIILAFPIIRLLFERGAFDTTATNMTAMALIFYSIGLIGTGLRDILSKVFYSLQDTKTPMINGILAVGVNIGLNLLLVRQMAHLGLALATSMADIFATILLFFSLQKKMGSIDIKSNITCFIKLGVSASIMGIVVYLMNMFISSTISGGYVTQLISLTIIIIVGAIVYILLCYMFKIKEVDMVIKYFYTRLYKDDNKESKN